MLFLALLVSTTADARRPVARITVVYDNLLWLDSAGNPAAEGLTTDWGFSALVETQAANVLFDTGTHAGTLLANMEALGLDPAAVDAVVLSHRHTDHTGGLAALLALPSPPEVFPLAGFSRSVPAEVRHTVFGADTVAGGVMTTGPVEGPLPEQALVVPTGNGPVVICGCSHPGADRMAAAAADVCGAPPVLLMGGFHMGGATAAESKDLASRIEVLGVQSVAPSHCTGQTARAALADAFGDGFCGGGLGWSFRVEGRTAH